MDDTSRLNERINQTNNAINEWIKRLDDRIFHADGATIDIISGLEGELESLKSDVRQLKIKKSLSDREHSVYELLLAEKKQVEIAKMLRLTKGRVSQIVSHLKAKGLAKFK